MVSREDKRLTLNIPEAAELLGISRVLGYELVARGEFPVPVIRLGAKRIVVSRRAIMELLGDTQGVESDVA